MTTIIIVLLGTYLIGAMFATYKLAQVIPHILQADGNNIRTWIDIALHIIVSAASSWLAWKDICIEEALEDTNPDET